MKIVFLGGGNMAGAILEGYLAEGVDPNLCHVVEVNEERRAFLEKQWSVKTSPHITEKISDADIIILAVKPQQMQEIAVNLQPYLKKSLALVISIAAGIRLEKLSQWLGSYTHIIRAMPNMAALIHAGITGLTALSSVTMKERFNAEKLMAAIGEVLWFDDETQLDAVTAVSGSGPAYVFYFIEVLQQAGESLGLTTKQARQLALKTFEGASRLALESSESASALREKVTSKGGTTEAALKHLDETQTKKHFIDAVHAAAKRAKELGN